MVPWERRSKRKEKKGVDYFHADFKLVFLQVQDKKTISLKMQASHQRFPCKRQSIFNYAEQKKSLFIEEKKFV